MVSDTQPEKGCTDCRGHSHGQKERQRLVVKVRKSPKVPERENGVVERRQRVAHPALTVWSREHTATETLRTETCKEEISTDKC